MFKKNFQSNERAAIIYHLNQELKSTNVKRTSKVI